MSCSEAKTRVWPTDILISKEITGNQNDEWLKGQRLNDYGPYKHFGRCSCVPTAVTWVLKALGVRPYGEGGCADAVANLPWLAHEALETSLLLDQILTGRNADRGVCLGEVIYIGSIYDLRRNDIKPNADLDKTHENTILC